jgi:hypothetical protein
MALPKDHLNVVGRHRNSNWTNTIYGSIERFSQRWRFKQNDKISGATIWTQSWSPHVIPAAPFFFFWSYTISIIMVVNDDFINFLAHRVKFWAAVEVWERNPRTDMFVLVPPWCFQQQDHTRQNTKVHSNFPFVLAWIRILPIDMFLYVSLEAMHHSLLVPFLNIVIHTRQQVLKDGLHFPRKLHRLLTSAQQSIWVDVDVCLA